MTNSRVQLTKHRLNALTDVMKKAGAEGALLILLDGEVGQLFGIPSYGVGSYADLVAQLENKAVFLRGIELDEADLVEAEEQLADFASAQGWKSSSDSWLASISIVAPDSELEPAHPSGKLLGFALFELPNSQEPTKFANAGVSTEDLSIAIQSTRDRRFREAILRLHGELANRSAELDYDEGHFFDLIKSEVSADEYKIHECDPYCQPDERRESPALLSLGRAAEQLPIGDERFVACEIDQKSLQVPLTELSYELESTRFTPRFVADQKFRRIRCVSKYVSFSSKNVRGYLQPFFSTEDRQVAGTMFDLAQGILDLEKIDASRSALLENTKNILSTVDGEEISVPEILPDIQTVAFFRVRVDIFGNPLSLLIDRLFGEFELPEDYCERLRLFASQFYLGDESRDVMQTGVDVQDDCSIHEFHMPSDEGASSIYLVIYEGKYISRAKFLEHHRIMENHFVALKQAELQRSRSAILSQTRHAVIHYFTLARDQLRLLKREWDDGRKDKNLWMSLLDDPDFEMMLENATWSIDHANQILENGRFLVREIDPQSIVKNTFDIEDVVEDCLRVLGYQKAKKALVFFHKISGKKDSRLTGDALLMRIALLNLFDNAIKYAPSRSQVRWALEYGREGYRFSISNVGDFIDPQQLALLLKVGFRAKQKDQLNRRPGTGIGLAVTQRILTAHHPKANLQLVSEEAPNYPGQSQNTFFFDMPYLTGIEHW